MSIIKAIKLANGKFSLQASGDTVGPITTAAGTLTRSTTSGSGTQSVTTGFPPSLVLFAGVNTADSQVMSDGWDNASIAQCTWSYDLTLLATIISTNTKDQANSVHIQSLAGSGYSAHITSTSSTGFTLTWAVIGSGLNISVQYLAIY
jgi:hypothetical protein